MNTMEKTLELDYTAAEMSMLDWINLQMHAGKCPTRGSLGECAVISTLHCQGSQEPYYIACLYLWDKDFNDSKTVASWFIEKGAENVSVSAVLYDPDNNVANGASLDDGVRPWEVTYFLPEKVPA